MQPSYVLEWEALELPDKRYWTIPASNQEERRVQKKKMLLRLFRLGLILLLISTTTSVGTFFFFVVILKEPLAAFVDMITIKGILLSSLGGILALAWPGAIYGAHGGPAQKAHLAWLTYRERKDGTQAYRRLTAIFIGVLGLMLIGIAIILGSLIV